MKVANSQESRGIKTMNIDEIETLEEESQLLLLEQSKRRAHCQKVVIENVFWAASVGLVPVPLVDVVGISAIQLKMGNEISLEYDFKFSKHQLKAVLASLTSGLTLFTVSSLKLIPGIGSTGAGIGVSALGGAVTYGIGHLFIEHFEQGGTVEDLDIRAARRRLKELTEEGKIVATTKHPSDEITRGVSVPR